MAHYMLWLLAGVVCLAAEALGATGIGLLFAGLGALTIGSFLVAVPQLSLLEQWIIFLACTTLWAMLLWKPLQKYRSGGNGAGYKNMVGDTVFASTLGLKQGTIGEVTWSGTIMRARLADGAASLEPGAQATIAAVEGNTLIVKPK